MTRTARLRLELCELVSSLSDSPWTVAVQAASSCIESSYSTTTIACTLYCDLYGFVKENGKYVFFQITVLISVLLSNQIASRDKEYLLRGCRT